MINFKKIINKTFNNKRFYKNFLLLSGSTILAQGLNILLSPIISRLYSPEEFGILTVFTTIIGILTISITLKYEWAIPIAKDDFEAKRIVKLCIYFLLLMTSVILILIIFFKITILEIARIESLADYVYYIPIGVLLVGLYNVMVQWALRKHEFKELSITRISQSFSQNLVKIIGGILNLGAGSLIIGRIIGQSIGIGPLIKTYRKIDLKEDTKRAGFNEYKILASRYKNFAIYSAPSQLLNSLGIQLPLIMLSFIFGIQEVGFYGLAYSVVSLPMSIIGISIGDTFYAEVSKSINERNDNIINLEKKLFKQLLIIGIIPVIILMLAGPVLFSFVYGYSWVRAGEYAKIISLLVFFRLIFTPITRIFSIFEKQKLELLLDVLRLVLTATCFVFTLIFKLTPINFMYLYTISMAVVYFISYIFGKNILKTMNIIID